MENLTNRMLEILILIDYSGELGTATILEELIKKGITASRPTVNRDIEYLVKSNCLNEVGSGPTVKYRLTDFAKLNTFIDTKKYFELNPENRNAKSIFNWDIFELLGKVEIFTNSEKDFLNELYKKFANNYSKLSETIRAKEIERVTIELSWKSSKIEGNTYTLLETENLLKNGISAKEKTSIETQMILNHKEAIKYIFENPGEFSKLTESNITHIHKLLSQNLNITQGFRKTLVGITGTIYRPIDNTFQIQEAIQKTCDLVNAKSDFFEKSLITMLMLSYIQAFEDGNKRTSRIMGNAILLANKSFPISFRSVDEIEYKEAVLLFYERNSIRKFKEVFLEQCEFAVGNYFGVSILS